MPYGQHIPKNGDPFTAHCISDHCISDQKVRTVMVRDKVRVRVRVGDAVVRNAVGRKVGNPKKRSNEENVVSGPRLFYFGKIKSLRLEWCW